MSKEMSKEMKLNVLAGIENQNINIATEYQQAVKKAAADLGFDFVTYGGVNGGLEIRKLGGEKITDE